MENNFLRKTARILMVNDIKITNKAETSQVIYFKNNVELTNSGFTANEWKIEDVKLTDEEDFRLVLLNRHLLEHPEAMEVDINILCMFVKTGFISPAVEHGLTHLSSQYEEETKDILLENVKSSLKEVRKEKENFGVIYQDQRVDTSEETLSTMVTILNNFELGVYDKVDYKTRDGFIKDMTKDQLKELITLANNWVNDAYKTESTILGTLEKMSVKDMVNKYDFNIGNDNKIHFEITDEIQYYFEQIFAVHSGNSDETLEEIEQSYLEHKKDEEDKIKGDDETQPTPPVIDPPKETNTDTNQTDQNDASGSNTTDTGNTSGSLQVEQNKRPNTTGSLYDETSRNNGLI